VFSDGKSTLLMLKDSHTSVLGMREYKNYEQCIVTDFERLEDFLSKRPSIRNAKNSLFVLTAMSNFCGRKYDLGIIKRIRRVFGDSFSVCLDAAALVPASPLDLHEVQVDFVAFSFYKLFGFPTGLGALLIRRGQEDKLIKRYFGGGTVEFVSPTQFDVVRRHSVEQR
jgi:molybdenum cofactor sulfurtransferase